MLSDSENLSATATVFSVLSAIERRVLGVLVEKSKTTPDIYPLSLNALVTGCNQKSNRDPLMNLSDGEVMDTLPGMQKKGLVLKIVGGRVERWRHQLYEAWHVGKVELAIIGELLLRGPQTEGELRGRAGRMEPIDDLDTLRNVLKPMVDRKLVVYLTPEVKRGTILTHGFHSENELARLRQMQPAEEPASQSGVPSFGDDEPASLREKVADLEKALAILSEDVRRIKEGLGL